MYLICQDRVLLGVDGFIRDPLLGSQVRVMCFGLNIWWAKDDKDPDGNGFTVNFGLPRISEVL